MREQSFVNGDPHGHCVVYDQRARIIQEMDYSQGKLDGVMTMYGTDGQVLKKLTYENGAVKKVPPPERKR
jgi:antitoxin component YwqK of YwqJK toxin-antitoxin module